MKRSAVSSSNLVSVGYDAPTQTLEVEFRGGSVYQYARCPQGAFNDLIKAASKESHFHRYIRAKYPTKRIK